jgi:hypothetical protein
MVHCKPALLRISVLPHKKGEIEMAANKTSRAFIIAGLALLATALAAEDGWAQRAKPSEGTRQQRMDCADDARFVCGRFIPDVERITACMKANKRQLSPQCRRHFR